MEAKEIIASLIKNGAKEIKDVTIKNITVTPMDEYVRLGLTINKEVDGYKTEEDGTYTPSKVNVIFVSAFAIASQLKDNDDAAFAANHLIKHPDSFGLVLSRAHINIVQEFVKAGEEYRNPFSDTAEVTTFDHDVIINHVYDIKLSKFGVDRLEFLANKMMGF